MLLDVFIVSAGATELFAGIFLAQLANQQQQSTNIFIVKKILQSLHILYQAPFMSAKLELRTIDELIPD